MSGNLRSVKRALWLRHDGLSSILERLGRVRREVAMWSIRKMVMTGAALIAAGEAHRECGLTLIGLPLGPPFQERLAIEDKHDVRRHLSISVWSFGFS